MRDLVSGGHLRRTYLATDEVGITSLDGFARVADL